MSAYDDIKKLIDEVAAQTPNSHADILGSLNSAYSAGSLINLTDYYQKQIDLRLQPIADTYRTSIRFTSDDYVSYKNSQLSNGIINYGNTINQTFISSNSTRTFDNSWQLQVVNPEPAPEPAMCEHTDYEDTDCYYCMQDSLRDV
jgi:hypothetical protein